MLNSQASVTGLYAREAVNLHRHLQRKLGDAAAAEDVMQDAFIRMMTLPANHASVRNSRAFLFTIANNLVVDSVRRNQRSQRLLKQAVPVTTAWEDQELHAVCPRCAVEDEVDAQLRLSKVMQVLRKLPPKCREAFVLHKFNELSYAEVSARLNVTVSMVEKYLSRALQHLRQYPELFEI